MSGERRPNVLWICTDSQRWDTLGCYGNDFVDTPNVDRLAERGVRFDRCFSQSPLCTPSRGSFLTGRYPVTTGLRQNGQEIPDDETLVTKVFGDEKWTCGNAGKLHLGPCDGSDRVEDRPYKYRERRIDDGYSEFHWSHAPSEEWPTSDYVRWLHDQGVKRSELVREHPDSEYVEYGPPTEYHDTTWTIDRTVSFIERMADHEPLTWRDHDEEFERPWLFTANVFDPHPGFDPPEEYLERYEDRLDEIPLPDHEPGELDEKPLPQREYAAGGPCEEMTERDHRLRRAAYWAMCDLIDDQVGRTLDALERTGQLEETLIVFTSDHGELLGDHGMYVKGPMFYEPSIRVPLVVAGPGVVEGETREALVELSDIAPTLLDAAGLEHPPGMQARSFWDLCTGERDADEHRDSVYCEYYNANPHDEPVFQTMVRTERYKLVNVHADGTPPGETPGVGGELYDLEVDPTEHENRWGDPQYADVKAELLKLCSDRQAFTADPLPPRRGIY